MRPGEVVTLTALLYMAVAGWLRRLGWRQQRSIVGFAVLGAALIGAIRALSTRYALTASVLGDWLPCLYILLVYWQAGRFFGKPSEKLQSCLLEFDRRWLGTLLDRWVRHGSRTWAGSYFELAYLFCYVLIPAGVGVLYWANQRAAVDYYWAIVLPSSYLCYAVLPLAQTLPPRLLPCASNGAPRASGKVRSLNLYILRRASIQFNTFPSGHVAATVAASLVVMRIAPAVGWVFLLIALSIAVGAVLGRYHYALDVILGAMLPLCILAISQLPVTF